MKFGHENHGRDFRCTSLMDFFIFVLSSMFSISVCVPLFPHETSA
jgi:hypothetical protein